MLLPLFAVVGMDRCEAVWYASDNNLRETPRGCRKKPNAGRYPIARLSTAVLCRGLEKNGMVRAWHGRGIASVNQTRPHCVNQMEKAHSKPFAARHARGTAWARHAMCESAFKRRWGLNFKYLPERRGYKCVQDRTVHLVTSSVSTLQIHMPTILSVVLGMQVG